jgi:hypothetical protein
MQVDDGALDAVVGADRTARLLRTLDHRLPAVTADAAIARARVIAARARLRRRLVACTAGAGTVLAAALAAALPSSPLHRYLWLTFGRKGADAVPRSALVERHAAGQTPTGAGIAVTMAGDVLVVFRASQIAGDIRIAFGPGRLVHITQIGHPRSAFVVTPQGVTVENTGSAASYALTLPASAPHARVLVGADTVFAGDGGKVTTAAVPDAAGGYLVHFTN